MDLKATYNRIAEDWHKDHQEDDWWKEGTDAFAGFLQKGDTILDVGCGAGTKSQYLMGKGLHVVGIDFAEKMIDIARKEVPGSTFLVCDLADVGKLDHIFDGAFIQAVLLHIPKKEVVEKLRNIAGKLRDGGYVYVAVKEKRAGGPEEETKVENDYGYSYERFFSYFTAEEMKTYFTQAGLEIVYSDIKPSGKTNWIQVIGRKL